jgi:predicted site-specific integrase-resolvase
MNEILNLTEVAEFVGISRPTLYKYLDRPEYKPEMVAGHPTLTREQAKAIKAERRKNGKRR